MPSDRSRVVVACAGSRKTTSIIEDALAYAGKRILITTYTNENLEQLRSYFVDRVGEVPPNVTLLSWYSFLLREGVRPYQSCLCEGERVQTVDFASEAPRYAKKSDVETYYLTKGRGIYRDRVADFVCHCDQRSGGLVVSRLEKAYDVVFVDELQDLAGYDLDLLERMFRSGLTVVAVGDPRQGTFSTNNARKNKRFKRAGVLEWIADKARAGLFSIEERTHCYRSNQAICDFADALFPMLSRSTSKNETVTGHDGIFEVRSADAPTYFETHRPIVLRWDRRTDTLGMPAHNIGVTKGRTFDRVLIFPTGPMKAYLKSKNLDAAGDLAKFYVAVTRARFSVAFVVN